MSEMWTKGTPINQNIAAGRHSPSKSIVTGIQGSYILPRNINAGQSPHSRHAQMGIQSI